VNDDEYMRTNIHALSGIQTHGLRIQEIMTYVSDFAVTGTGYSPGGTDEHHYKYKTD
jgi:hypothetical protein